MPAPIKFAMATAAKGTFAGKSIKIPMEFSKPSGEKGDIYDGTFQPSEKMTAPGGTPPLFQPASLVKYHTQAQTEMTKLFNGLFDDFCGAICAAWGNWMSMATMQGIVVNGPIASAGQVVAPPMTPLLIAEMPKGPPQLLKYVMAVSNTIGAAWDIFAASIKFSASPLFPLFAAAPGPVAPPQISIPVPFASLISVPASLTPSLMAKQMFGMLGDPRAPHAQELFDSVCDAFDKMFTLWKSTTMVMNVMSMVCPVPTFAPPVVPVGPVVGGVAMMQPGGFK